MSSGSTVNLMVEEVGMLLQSQHRGRFLFCEHVLCDLLIIIIVFTIYNTTCGEYITIAKLYAWG